MTDLDLTTPEPNPDLVVAIEVGSRLLAMPYLSALLRRLCGRPQQGGAQIADDHLANGIVSLAERVIVEHHRRSTDISFRIELVAGDQPEVRLHLDTDLAGQLAGEVLNHSRAIDREADVSATPTGLVVALSARGARFVEHLGNSSPPAGSDYAPRG